MPNYLHKTDTDRPHVTKLEREETMIGRLTSSLRSLLGNIDVRVNQLENCYCPCNIARWDTPTNVNYVAGSYTAVEYGEEILEGKLCRSNSTDKWTFRAQKSGVYSVGAYMKFTIDVSNPITNETRLVIYKNGDFWSELDSVTAVSSLSIAIGGTDIVNLDKGDEIQIMINPEGNPIQFVIGVYGYVNVSYQCSYQDNGVVQS